MKDVFEELEQHQIIQNYDLLNPNVIPNKLIGRDDKIRDLAVHLQPALRGAIPAQGVVMSGSTGTGKTAVAKSVTDLLQKKVKRHIKIIYLNATGSAHATLEELASKYNNNTAGATFERMLRMFYTSVEADGRKLVIILDEIDKGVANGVERLLLHLARRRDICLIFISNIGGGLTSIIDKINDKSVKSSIAKSHEMEFLPYTIEQLVAILRDRVKSGAVRPGTVSDRVLKYCAASAEQGDARQALKLLYGAAVEAQKAGAEEVEVFHVKISEKSGERDKLKSLIGEAPLRERIILDTLAKNGGKCLCQELFDKALPVLRDRTKLAGNLPKSSKTWYLTDLQNRGLITRRPIGKRNGSKGVDWEVSISPNWERSLLTAVVEESTPSS